ncbi:MAG: hypothetical protein LBF16_08380 [Pseudomonadales bacterium]|jgi:hypothetical protein|nr:hypothetical protein [Pseudomonadales bacterium]
MKIFNRIVLPLALVAAITACGKQEEATAAAAITTTVAAAAPAAAATTPDGSVLTLIRALRNNDFNALINSALPVAEVAQFKSDWTSTLNAEPITADDRQKFAEQMAQLTAPGAEERLFAEIEPQLKQLEAQAAQMPLLIMMGQGMLQGMIEQNQELSSEQRQQSMALIAAAGQWAQTVKIADPALAKAAIATLTKAARDLNLKSLDELRALNYDQGMAKAGIAFASAKQIAAIYGLQIDQWLDSVKTETVSTSGDTAQVKISYTAFDQPFTTADELVKMDGRWYSKQVIEQTQK